MQTSLADALKQFLRTSRLGSGLRSVQISEIWEQVMGQTIARSTGKVELVNRTLFISTAVAPLKSELHFSRDLIKRRINEQLGEVLVEEVVIR